jgi:hypothetical protein
VVSWEYRFSPRCGMIPVTLQRENSSRALIKACVDSVVFVEGGSLMSGTWCLGLPVEVTV